MTAKLKELAGQHIEGSDRLANDLALDSLTIMELAAWLENEFGIPIENTAALETVNDCFLAAGGQVIFSEEVEVNNVQAKWFNATTASLTFERGQLITASFLKQAKKTPSKILLADQISGE